MMWFSCINVGCSKLNLNTVPQIKLHRFNITSYVNFYMKQRNPNTVSRITEFLGIVHHLGILKTLENTILGGPTD